ncbi:nucleotidyltransferase family protein [Halobaculum sp. D14]|uniref:nucleotidyltransferase family protein n=1 Tax=Halobaculum sp. D14 TaxID=3421642 RepID=UPI003EBEE2ED
MTDTDTDLPVYDAERIPTPDRSGDAAPSVVGVLLAAGTSSRFGDANKLLAELDGRPLVRHAARTLLDADLAAVVAVVGWEAGAVRDALGDAAVRVVENPDYADGLASSVARGVGAAADLDADAAVFLPGDMPTVASSTVRRLVDAYRADVGTALAAAHDGVRGNPVLFDRAHFGSLRRVDGDVGGRAVLRGSDAAALVDVGDAGVVVDVDTPQDLTRAADADRDAETNG